MDKRLVEAVVHFEVHILMTMKLRIKMSHEEAKLEAKLAEQGISLSNAEHIHKRIAGALGDEESYFVNLKRLLGIPGQDPELRYDSIVWPGFEFRAVLGSDGCVESAQYWHTAGNPLKTGSPIEVPIWSMDLPEFLGSFGPLSGRHRRWPLTDTLLAGYEEYEFIWAGDTYGVGFSWGLFMFASRSWD